MTDLPFSYTIPMPSAIPSRVDNHIERRLSSLKGQFLNEEAFGKMLAKEDSLIYEVYEVKRPEVEGEILMGISIVHPGKVGDEFYMTKGHFHTVIDTAEVYYCLRGEGFMVMETPEGNTSVEKLFPGSVLYVPPRWAHRSVCTSRQEDLVTFFAYPGNAGHDYGTIERSGFRKLVMDSPSGIQIVDNPRFK
ncbi:MAG: glucose-6-phosphate isomerase family protein [Anaerolineaceae bacterium]